MAVCDCKMQNFVLLQENILAKSNFPGIGKECDSSQFLSHEYHRLCQNLLTVRLPPSLQSHISRCFVLSLNICLSLKSRKYFAAKPSNFV